MLRLLCCCPLLLTILAAAAAENVSPVGRTVESFALQDYRGKAWSLDDLQDKKLVVVAFLGTECPLAKLYGPRLAQLSAEYEARGVAFIGINANRQDSIAEIAAHARDHKIEFPILKDSGNRVADQFTAERTPEIFVLDQQKIVRYHGRIDDQYGVGTARPEATRQHLKSALDELLAGQSVSLPSTEAVGCYIGRIREPDPNSPVTYSNQIARLFRQRCVECHRDGEIAPFALTNYEEVVGWAETIEEVVRDQRMPPWHASPDHGEFLNARMLPDEEKKLIYQWVAAGAPEGDPAELPEPRTFTEGWQLTRAPDDVFYMREEPFKVPAEGVVQYQYFNVDPEFTEDKWIAQAQVIPGNRAVVHHVVIFVRGAGQRGRGFSERGSQFLVAYVPGLRTTPPRPGMAKKIPAGSQLVFQVHYTPIGTEQLDRSMVGLIYADPEEVEQQVLTIETANSRIAIPPQADNHREESTRRAVDYDVTLLSMAPHMHLRGKSFRYEAILPDGSRKTLLDVPRYDFNWQTSYQLAEPMMLPAGTRMHCVAHYDNSEGNLANPDSSAEVRWGDQTWQEMMIGYFDVAVPRKLLEELAAQSTPEEGPDPEKRADQFFTRLDQNQDGKISRDEVPEQARPIFDQADADKDGIVTREELIKAIKVFTGNRGS